MKTKALFAAFALFTSTAWANNIQVSDVSLVDHDETEFNVLVRFDISWENSWRTSSAPNNWDAAWVFVKYRNASTGLWEHARLHNNPGHTAPPGSMIKTGFLDPSQPFFDANNPGIGVFIHRNADGTGTFTASGVELRWNYWANNVSFENIAEVKVFAIEMVLVPEGSFWVGDGGSGPSSSGRFIAGGSTNAPFLITSEAALPIANTAEALWGTATSGFSTIGGAGTLPAAYPKGFAAFYLMKYSLAQQDYVDFLNTLTRAQQNTRTETDLAVGVTSVSNRYVMSNSAAVQWRNGIRCDASIDAGSAITFYCDLNSNGIGGEGDDGQWIACNYLNWADLAAYLDWSGLRPMTELEYEKACRGPVTPVADEYAWGNANIRFGNYTATDPGSITERVSDPETGPNGNALYVEARITPNGPGRVGLFAGDASNRVNAGASYYGAMELSGNLWERPVSVGNAQGRAFTGSHGDGLLDLTGGHDAASWPASDALGAGFRGGHWFNGAPSLRVSHRNIAAWTYSDRRDAECGRGVRIAPTTDCPGLGDFGAPCTPPIPGAPAGSGTVTMACTCEIVCLADAGTLSGGGPTCLVDGAATLSATPNGDAVVPSGYSVIHFLSVGISEVIVDSAVDPSFNVTGAGLFTVHTLVYDPATLDLDIVEYGVTTTFDIDALIIASEICADITTGSDPAPFIVEPC